MDAGNWIAVTSVNDVSKPGMRAVQVGGASIAIYNVDGNFYATSNVCTHATAFLTQGYLEGTMIECPLHGGQFDIVTGKGLCAPVSRDLRTFPVRVTGDTIEIYVE